MSQTTETQEQDNKSSVDKKEIADEEREKMLNAENTKHSEAPSAPDENKDEAEEQQPQPPQQKPKRSMIPFNGVRLPFPFGRPKSPKSKEQAKVSALIHYHTATCLTARPMREYVCATSRCSRPRDCIPSVCTERTCTLHSRWNNFTFNIHYISSRESSSLSYIKVFGL